MREPRPARGLLDTSVVIDLDQLSSTDLPVTVTISTITLAELACGPHATDNPQERARRQETLQRVEATMQTLAFDAAAARAYARVFAAVRSAGRKVRGARAVDLMIAAVACAHELPLYTRNPDDFHGLEDLVPVIPV